MELNNMILIYIEGNLIENMIIQEDKLLFSDVDSEDNTVYKTVPVNEYEKGIRPYNEVEDILYKSYNLDLGTAEGITNFKEAVQEKFIEGIFSFKYNGLTVKLEGYEKDTEIVII